MLSQEGARNALVKNLGLLIGLHNHTYVHTQKIVFSLRIY